MSSAPSSPPSEASPAPSKAVLRSLIVVILVAIVGLSFAFGAGSNSVTLAGLPVPFWCALLAFAINWIAFVPATIAQSDKYYDTTGALTYVSVIILALYASGPLDTRALVIAAMVMIWTIRLGSFLFTRIHAAGGTDQRFEKIKINPPRFLAAWTLQAAWVIFTSSAAIVAITAQNTPEIGVFFALGAAMWLVGFAIEAVADEQKRRFKADPANKGRFIQSGLWAYSQHPNYFGEILLWSGILVMALPVLEGFGWLAVFSPIFVTLLLTKVSGINLLDKIAKERWGNDPEWQRYTARTSTLIPLPPRSGGAG